MASPANCRYTKEHEWIRVEGNVGAVGITDHAQEALGDIVFVELPSVGQVLAAHGQFGTVESVKAVSELFCPVAGEVVETNSALTDTPESVNKDPYGAWMIKITIANPSEVDSLMTAEQYDAYVSEEK